MSRRETPGHRELSSEENANTEWERMVAKRGEFVDPTAVAPTTVIWKRCAAKIDEAFSS